MSNKNLLAFLCAAIGAGLSLSQTVVSIPDLYIELSFLDILFRHNSNKELFSASCLVAAIAAFAALCGLCALFRKGKGFYVWGLAGCSAVYISAICFYTSNLQAGEAINMTFQAWHKTYLVWGLLFLAAALCAFRDYKVLAQQDNNELDTDPSPETPLQTGEQYTSAQSEAVHADTTTLTEQAYTFLTQGNFHEAQRYCREALKHNQENSAAYLGQLMAQLKVRSIDELSTVNVPLAENKLFQLAMLFAGEEQRTSLQKCLTGN